MLPERITFKLNKAKCHTCGHTWTIGQSGRHSCAQHLLVEIERLKAMLKTAHKDQRHACADAVSNIPADSISPGRGIIILSTKAYQACMNAEVTK